MSKEIPDELQVLPSFDDGLYLARHSSDDDVTEQAFLSDLRTLILKLSLPQLLAVTSDVLPGTVAIRNEAMLGRDAAIARAEKAQSKCSRQRRELRRLNRSLAAIRGIYRDTARDGLERTCVELGKARDREAQRATGLESELAALRAREAPEAAWRRCASFFMSAAGEQWIQEHQCNCLLPTYEPPLVTDGKQSHVA